MQMFVTEEEDCGNYLKITQIGRGAYGNVFLVKPKSACGPHYKEQLFALKITKKSKCNVELEVFQKAVNHPCLLQLVEFFETKVCRRIFYSLITGHKVVYLSCTDRYCCLGIYTYTWYMTAHEDIHTTLHLWIYWCTMTLCYLKQCFSSLFRCVPLSWTEKLNVPLGTVLVSIWWKNLLGKIVKVFSV